MQRSARKFSYELTRLAQKSHPEIDVILLIVYPFLPLAFQSDHSFAHHVEMETWNTELIFKDDTNHKITVSEHMSIEQKKKIGLS